MISTQANKVFSLSARGTPVRKILMESPYFTWRESVLQRLEDLIRLEKGWDGYEGLPVSLENATFALQMLEVVCDSNTSAPQIVPGFEGDLQIEWHTLEGDVELHVRAPNDVHAWRLKSNDDAQEEELELRNDFLVAAQWVKEVTEPSIAIEAAAA